MGKIELDHTGTGGGITLSSDGTDLLLDGTAIGGGGGTALELYAESYDGTSGLPVATGSTNAVAIGRAYASGADSFAAAIANNTSSYGATGANSVAIGRLAKASGSNSVAIGNFTKAAGAQSVVVGYQSNDTSTGEGAAAFGRNADAGSPYSAALGPESVTAGLNNYASALTRSYASGADSFAAAIANNTSSYGATGSNSLAIGKQNKATATISTAVGGQNCVASHNYAFASGNGSTASGYASTSIGHSNTASEFYTVSTGGFALANLWGKQAHASGAFGTVGDAQTGTLVLRSETTDATASVLTSTNGAASTNNQVILPNNSAYSFSGTIVARQKASDGTASAAWKIEGLIRKEGIKATTVLVNSALTVLDNTPAWGLALTADTTNGGLKIEVTGAAATNIRWVATINTSEVTYT